MVLRHCIVVLALCAGAGLASADDLRDCNAAEAGAAQRAPMPKMLGAIREVSTDGVHRAGYLIAIDAAGTPSVACAMAGADTMIRAKAARAAAKLGFWPEDATPPGTLAFIEFQSQGYGLTIPSVLPKDGDPECSTLVSKVVEPPAASAIYQPKMIYPKQASDQGIGGTLLLVTEVRDTGANFLVCRGSGNNVDPLREPAYYNAAGIRYAPQPGRPPFYVKLEYSFRMRTEH